MDLTNMTPTERAAWHRSEAARIEAEERARRPALDYEGLLALAKEQAKIAASYLYPPGDARVQRTEEAMAHSLFLEYTVSPLYSALRSRDVLRVVPPDPPAPQVAPEPTGAELVGRRCWVRFANCEAVGYDPSTWEGPSVIERFDGNYDYPYGVGNCRNSRWAWYREAKPYVEGVAP